MQRQWWPRWVAVGRPSRRLFRCDVCCVQWDLTCGLQMDLGLVLAHGNIGRVCDVARAMCCLHGIWRTAYCALVAHYSPRTPSSVIQGHVLHTSCTSIHTPIDVVLTVPEPPCVHCPAACTPNHDLCTCSHDRPSQICYAWPHAFPILPTLTQGWRQHFLDTMQPKFLPPYWSVNSRVANSTAHVMPWPQPHLSSSSSLSTSAAEEEDVVGPPVQSSVDA